MEKKKDWKLEAQKYYQTNKKISKQRNEKKTELGIKSHLGFQCIEDILKND